MDERPTDRLRTHARAMRLKPTAAERRLWSLLRAGRLEGFKFRRQVPMGPYIADFVCPEQRLVVEADGWGHEPAADAARDAWMRARGFRVLRLSNQDILDQPDGAARAILAALRRQPG